MSRNEETSNGRNHIRALICNAAAGASAGNYLFCLWLWPFSYYGFFFIGCVSILWILILSCYFCHSMLFFSRIACLTAWHWVLMD